MDGGRSDEQVLRLERELGEARLELAQRDRSIERLRAEVGRVRDAAAQDARERGQANVERLVVAIGAPLVQFMTQAHLHRTGLHEVRVGDVLDVGTRLVRSLREVGVDMVGKVGEAEPYDPDRHDPLSTAAVPVAGERIVVRVVGLSYRDRVVRKAGVEPAGGGGR
jgi:molecular chaperone GrpE (heat shock protein)